jgi:nucleotide-binding universal stress UspA family protein
VIVLRTPGFHRILFAVNGSEHSAATVPLVTAIAAKSHAEVLVLHVSNPDDVRLEHDDDLSRRRNDEIHINTIVNRLSAAAISATGESPMATDDSVAAVIANRAGSFNADLIAMGNRGLSELHTFLIGSRTQQVLARATTPVLAVRNAKHRPGRGIDRVVLALDGSVDPAYAVQACVDIAQPASAELDVIDFGKRNDRRLSQAIEELAQHGITPRWRHARGDRHPADEILALVSDSRADLLIIGPTAAPIRGGLGPEVMTRLLQSCPCPLLVAPTGKPAKATGRASSGSEFNGAPEHRFGHDTP